MVLLLPILAFVIGFAILIWSADRFVVGAAATAHNLNVAPIVIGITIVGLGTSAPEMLVSAIAAMQGSDDISVGNALGSNITNVGLVLGVSALIKPLSVHPKLMYREIPILLGVMLLAFLLMWDMRLQWYDGVILLSGMVWMIARAFYQARSTPQSTEEIPDEAVKSSMTLAKGLIWIVVGLALMLMSSKMVVWGAIEVARVFEVNELLIGLTIVAIGTSLPEFTATVVAAVKGEHDIAVGNVIGSNIFNLFVVLGLPAVLAEGHFNASALYRDLPVAFSLVTLLFFMSMGIKRRGLISRTDGLLLLLIYISYVSVLILEPETKLWSASDDLMLYFLNFSA